MSRLKGIAYELKNLWESFTRQELCDYYDITSRTLYTYSKKLDLPKKIDKNIQNEENKVELWLHKNDEYQKQTFRNWDQFAKWSKAQSCNIRIGSHIEDGKNYVTCDFLNKKEEAKIFEKSLHL